MFTEMEWFVVFTRITEVPMDHMDSLHHCVWFSSE